MTRCILAVIVMVVFSNAIFAQLTVETDNPTAYYEAGDNMNFVVTSGSSGTVEYTISYHKFAPDIETGTIDVSGGQAAYIPFSSDDPTMVTCKVRKGSNSDEAAAAFSPYDIESFVAEPTDFDAFWNTQLADLANVPMDAQLQYYEQTDYTKTYKLELASIDNWRVYGYITIPEGTGPFPAILTLPPYGDNANIVTPAETIAERGGAISVAINIHNVEPDEQDSNAYENSDVTDKEGYYYRYSILGAVRAIDYIFSRDDFDGESMGVVGVSQGGGLSTIVAGLDQRVNLLVQSNGTMGQHSGHAFDRAAGFPYYVRGAENENIDIQQVVDASRYYDAIFFAKRYNGPSLSIISYLDDICPPATVFAFYDQFRGPKVLLHAKELGHTHPNEYWSGRLDFMRRHFPAMQTPPWPWPDSEVGYFVNAGPDLTVSNACEVNLAAEMFLEDQSIDSWPVQWTMIEGPGTATFGDANDLNTSVSFSQEGTYVLRFTGDDLENLEEEDRYYTLTDYVTITISGSGTEAPEVELFGNSTVTSAFDVEVVFNQSVSGLSLNEFTITNGTATGLSGSGTTYTLTVDPTAPGAVQITLPANAAIDCAGTGNAGSNVLTVNYEEVSGVLELACPDDISLLAPNGSNGIDVSWPSPNAGSSCPVGEVSLTQIAGLANGSEFPIGQSIITYQATDACGNTVTCSFEIRIEEEEETPDPDCESESENPWKEYIKRIEFGAIDNESGKTTYSDFTDESTIVDRGTTVPFKLTLRYTSNERSDEFIKVWIDFNQDGAFDEATETAASIFFPATYGEQIHEVDANILIPTTATNGTARMRVSLKRDGYATPCESFEFGEVEDYTVNITGEVGPILSYTCPSDIVVTADFGATLALVQWDAPVATTTCPTSGAFVTQTSGPQSGTLFPIGVTEVAYAFFDFCQNGEVCSFTVTVQEPTTTLNVACPDDLEVASPNGPEIVNWQEPAATSDCPLGVVSITQISGPANGSVLAPGFSNVTYSISDGCGNVQSCSFDIFVSAEPQEICASEGDFPWNDWIYKVKFDEISNTSGKRSYSDFTDEVTYVSPNAIYSIELTAKTSYFGYDQYWKVWIDYNQNGVFEEATETVLSAFAPAEEDGITTSKVTALITIPGNAAAGECRMRVSKKRGSYPTPCEFFEFGEVEDYTVIVSSSIAGFAGANSDDSNVALSDAVRLFPNPVRNYMTIDFGNFAGKLVHYDLVDVRGQIIESKSFVAEDRFEDIDCSKLSQGIYSIRLISKGEDIVVKRFVKVLD